MDLTFQRALIFNGISCALMSIVCLLTGYFGQAAPIAYFGIFFGLTGGIAAYVRGKSIPKVAPEIQIELDKLK